MIFPAVTFGLAKKRPMLSSPARSPPSRLRQVVLRSTMRSRIEAPLYRGADLRMSQLTNPSRGSCSPVAEGERIVLGPRRARFFLIDPEAKLLVGMNQRRRGHAQH